MSQTRFLIAGTAAVVGLLMLVSSSFAQPAMSVTRVASGLSRPVFGAVAPGDSGRMFIVEQHTGRIRILNLATGTINTTPFLDINGNSTGNEQGLLGLAFHPDYVNNGLFYVNYTDATGTTVVQEYARTNSNQANAGSAQDVANDHAAVFQSQRWLAGFWT